MPSLVSGQHFARASGSLMIFYFRFLSVNIEIKLAIQQSKSMAPIDLFSSSTITMALATHPNTEHIMPISVPVILIFLSIFANSLPNSSWN